MVPLALRPLVGLIELVSTFLLRPLTLAVRLFANMVAGHLMKYCHFVEDTEGFDMQLRYIRDTDGREIDFVVLRDGDAEFAVECKSGEKSASPACRYFRDRTDIPRFYQVHLGQKDFGNADTGTRVLPFLAFCRGLELP